MHSFSMNVQTNITKRQSFPLPPSPGAPRFEWIDATKGQQDLEMLSKSKARVVEDLVQALSDVSGGLNRQRA